MVVTIKKILLTLIFLTQTMGNTMAGDLSVNDKFEIIDVMNNYANGINHHQSGNRRDQVYGSVEILQFET